MEGSDNTSALFSGFSTTDVKHENTEQFLDAPNSDIIDNDTYKSVNSHTDSPRLISSIRDWRLFGKNVPKNEVIFICQVVILYVIILTCIINLSLGNGDSNLWTALLSSSLGIMLPAPSLSTRRRH